MRMPKVREPDFWFVLPTGQPLIYLSHNQFILVYICGFDSNPFTLFEYAPNLIVVISPEMG